jgi:hypothetical protein
VVANVSLRLDALAVLTRLRKLRNEALGVTDRFATATTQAQALYLTGLQSRRLTPTGLQSTRLALLRLASAGVPKSSTEKSTRAGFRRQKEGARSLKHAATSVEGCKQF